MWTDGQRLERDEVEHWISSAYPYLFFKASVAEKEEPSKGRVRIITTITGPNGERLVHPIEPNVTACYYALRDLPGMAQMDSEWVC